MKQKENKIKKMSLKSSKYDDNAINVGFYNKNLGNMGEKIACEYLEKNSFQILTRNYYRRVGEIDIIALKHNVIHFIEVKSVSRETYFDKYNSNSSIYRPEIRVSYDKMFHMKQAINLFITENNLYNHLIQVDIITVDFYLNRSEPTIRFIENIQLD